MSVIQGASVWAKVALEEVLAPRVSQHHSQGTSHSDTAADTPGRPHGKVMGSAVLAPWSSSGPLIRAQFLGSCPTLPRDVLES